MYQKFNLHSVFAVLAMVIAGFGTAYAQETAPTLTAAGGAGDLMVAPTRLVLEGRTRATEITLGNKAAKEATYRISFSHLQMQEDGTYKDITETEAKTKVNSADELLRYSPRQVTLKPGESQVIKIMVRKPEGLAPGEYISHLLFRAVPDLASGEDVEAATKGQDGQIAIQLIPVYGVSIPVIVREGALSAQAKITGAQLGQAAVTATINRTGTKSLFGDLFVLQGSKVVGELRSISVLAYNAKRNISVPVTATTGPLTLEYRERTEDGGKVLDSVEIR